MNQVVTWVLIVCGWVVVHYLSAVRDRQREIAALAEAVEVEISKLALDAVAFHFRDTHDFQASVSITSKISRISRRLQVGPLSRLNVPAGLVVALRQAITLRNFDASSFKKLNQDAKQIRDIGQAAEDLSGSVEDLYATRYLANPLQIFRI